MSAESLPRLLLITDRQRAPGRSIVDLVAWATDAGLRFVQVREPDLDDDALLDLLEAIRRRVPQETWIAVNGRPALAREAGAGLHLPAAAGTPDLTGIEFWGRSAHDRQELGRAMREAVDYLILGTLFPTRSKPGHPGRGLAWLRSSILATRGTPVYAIGGIDAVRTGSVLAAGAHGVAVCGAILEAGDPGGATRTLLACFASEQDDRPARH